MMMIADMERCRQDLLAKWQIELEKVGEEIGVAIKCQREEIFHQDAPYLISPR